MVKKKCSKHAILQAVFLCTSLSTLLPFLYIVTFYFQGQVDQEFLTKKAAQFIMDGSTPREKEEIKVEWDPPVTSFVKMEVERKSLNINASNVNFISTNHSNTPRRDKGEDFVETPEVLREISIIEFSNLKLRDKKEKAATDNSSTSQFGNANNVNGGSDSEQHGREVVAKHSWNYSLPWHNGASIDQYEDSGWFNSLIRYLKTVDRSEPIIMVCSDKTFIEGLLNWLIWTFVLQDTPPRNVMVVTNRVKVCSLIEGHGIPVYCLKLSVDSILNKRGVDDIKGHQFSHLLAIRMSVMRILNHLGHHVMNLDSDAIMLKNPIPVLEQNGDSDVVGTYGGALPYRLFRKWGVVACMGTVLIRSTPATGERGMWRAWGQF